METECHRPLAFMGTKLHEASIEENLHMLRVQSSVLQYACLVPFPHCPNSHFITYIKHISLNLLLGALFDFWRQIFTK
jgi:hypothetical protein